MSFDAYITCCKDGELGSFPVVVVYDLFKEFITEVSPDKNIIEITFEKCGNSYDGSTLYLDLVKNDLSSCHGFNINRPSGDVRLYEGLLKLMQSTYSVFYCASSCPPLVGQVATIAHIPIEVIESLGNPVLISEAHAIPEMVRNS